MSDQEDENQLQHEEEEEEEEEEVEQGQDEEEEEGEEEEQADDEEAADEQDEDEEAGADETEAAAADGGEDEQHQRDEGDETEQLNDEAQAEADADHDTEDAEPAQAAKDAETAEVESELAESGVIVIPGSALDELGLESPSSSVVRVNHHSIPSAVDVSPDSADDTIIETTAIPMPITTAASSKSPSQPSSQPASKPTSKPPTRPSSAQISTASAAVISSASIPSSKTSSRHSSNTSAIDSTELSETAAATVDSLLNESASVESLSVVQARTPSPPPRPITPIDYNAGSMGDCMVGPQRVEISTEGEKEIKQMKYASEMAQQWIELIQKRSQHTSNHSLTTQQTTYLLQHLVPILVEALSELLRVHEEEAHALHQHNKKLRKNPSMKPRSEFRPLEWLAAYLVRHNPQHVQNNNPLTLIYQKNLNEIVNHLRNQSQQIDSKEAE